MIVGAFDERRALRLLWIGAPGICHFCGCTELDACRDGEFGCSWRDETLRVCSVCGPAAAAEAREMRALRAAGWSMGPEFRRAVHLGFVVGWFGVSARSPYGRNPFTRPEQQRGWDMGQLAGAAARLSHVLRVGPVTNQPRRAVLRQNVAPSRDDRARARVASRVRRQAKSARRRRAWVD
jgi:hypothetical protein